MSAAAAAATADFSLWFLLVKMLVTAGFVVSASLIAERTGPLIAAMVATLPVSAGPVYAFLAMEHSDAFIARAALGSMASNMATTAFAAAYVLAAQRLGTAGAIAAAFAAWAPTLLLFRQLDAGLPALLVLTLAGFPLIHAMVRPYLAARPRNAPRLAWYAVPVRAAVVSVLVGAVTTASAAIGPHWSGLFATFPVVLSTLAIFVQPRIGGPATAAIIASGVLGLMGFGVALAATHLAAQPLGRWPALGLGLAICIIWNLALVALSRRRAATA